LGVVHEYITDGKTHLIMYANIHTMNLAHSLGPMRSAGLPIRPCSLRRFDLLGAWLLKRSKTYRRRFYL
jgi:hypothetical protein